MKLEENKTNINNVNIKKLNHKWFIYVEIIIKMFEIFYIIL